MSQFENGLTPVLNKKNVAYLGNVYYLMGYWFRFIRDTFHVKNRLWIKKNRNKLSVLANS